MREKEFNVFMKKNKRSESATKRAITFVKEFERYLEEIQRGKNIEEVGTKDIENFVEWIEKRPKTSAKLHLWGIAYYYEFIANEKLREKAIELRQQRIKRKPFQLKNSVV